MFPFLVFGGGVASCPQASAIGSFPLLRPEGRSFRFRGDGTLFIRFGPCFSLYLPFSCSLSFGGVSVFLFEAISESSSVMPLSWRICRLSILSHHVFAAPFLSPARFLLLCSFSSVFLSHPTLLQRLAPGPGHAPLFSLLLPLFPLFFPLPLFSLHPSFSLARSLPLCSGLLPALRGT